MLPGCPYCFGAADSTQVQAAKAGVLVLLAFIVPLLGAIAFIARSWAKRARELTPQGVPSGGRSAPSITLTASRQ